VYCRLQDSEEQEAVRRHPDARWSGRVGSQVRATDSWYGRLGVTIPVGHGHDRHQATGYRSGHSSATQGIVVAWFSVRVPVRHPIVTIAIPRGRVVVAFSSISVPTAAADQHSVAHR